jgi:hypothetical protein
MRLALSESRVGLRARASWIWRRDPGTLEERNAKAPRRKDAKVVDLAQRSGLLPSRFKPAPPTRLAPLLPRGLGRGSKGRGG